MPDIELTSFTSLAGVPFHYARPPVAPYGTRGKAYKFRCQERLIAPLEASVRELGEICPLGPPEVITSAGAYVGKSGQHGRGLAVDIDGIFWPDRDFVTQHYPLDPRFYLAVECVFRRNFGLGLNYLYNKAHEDHLHLDLGKPVDFDPSSRSYVLFLQAALNHIHHSDIVIDGNWGPQTEATAKKALKDSGSTGRITTPATWKRFLLHTARMGFEAPAESPISAAHHAGVLNSVVEHLGIDGSEWQMLRGSLDVFLNTPELSSIFEDDSTDQTIRLGICKKIVDFEARRKKGKIVVYNLPSADGGGTYEVAGINERYHPEMAAKLAKIIRKDRDPDRAEALAILYIATYTDAAARWTRNSGIESYLRDSMWNRGPGGAAKILQMALGFKKAQVDGLIGPQTLGALALAGNQPLSFLS